MIALITKRNNPRVIIVIGIVRITKIGFTRKRNNAITTATMIAETYPSTATPGSNFANKTTASAVNNTLISVFIYICYINKAEDVMPKYSSSVV